MAYTSHGHLIVGSPKHSAEKPESVARCGGPGLCSVCNRESMQWLNQKYKE